MGKFLKNVGVFFATLKGWLYLVGVAPAIVVTILGFIEPLSWSLRISVMTITLAAGLLVVYFGIGIWEKSTNHFTTRREQKRIASELQGLIEDQVTEVDTGSVAAIWAGTLDANNIVRHLRFRRIKAAINNGEIRNTFQRPPIGKRPAKGANMYTWIPIEELRRYFIERHIISEKDIPD